MEDWTDLFSDERVFEMEPWETMQEIRLIEFKEAIYSIDNKEKSIVFLDFFYSDLFNTALGGI